MICVRVLPGAKGKDIDLPESVTHRSGGASVLLIPGQTNELTEQEWEHIERNHPDVLPGIQVLSP